MFSDENKSSSLAKFLNPFDYVILDTCSLMEDGFPLFMDVLVNAKDYLRNDRRIVIYGECLAELKKHAKNRKDDSARIAAKRALKILRSFRFKRYKPFEYTRKGNRNQNFADNVIYVNVSQRRITQKILVITQDKGLAGDLRRLNELDSQHGRKVSTYKILPDGTLDVNHGEMASKAPWKEKKEYGFSKRNDAFKKPTPKPKPALSEALSKAIEADRRLKANLSNANYPDSKKVLDIESQLSLLSALKGEEKKNEQLHLSENQLKEELAKRKAAQKPETKKETSAPSSPKTEKKAETQPVLKKPEAAKEAKRTPAAKENDKPTGPRGEARKIENAIRDCAAKNGILLRDASIPYFAQVHGPIDLTEADIPAIAKGLGETPKAFLYKGIVFTSDTSNRGFSVWMSKKPEAQKPLLLLPKEEVKSPFPKDPRPSPLKEAKEMVDAPAKTKEAKKKKAEEKSISPAPKAKKAAKAKEKESPKKETLKDKAAEKKAAKPKREAKAKATKTEAKPKTASAKKDIAPKKPSAAKESKAKKDQGKSAPKKASASLEEAKKSETRLQSVIANSNYPLESKKADIQAQIALIKKLKASERKALKYDEKALDALLKGLE